MRRLPSLLASLLLASCAEPALDTSKLEDEESDFALGDPGKADGVLSSADRARIEAAFDAAIASGEATIGQLEAEIAQLEASHAQKQAEADALVMKIAAREEELRRQYNNNTILCVFLPNPATCLFANYLANDSTMRSYKQQLANAQAEQSRIRTEIAEYNTKRDAVRARLVPIRAGKERLLAMLRGEAPPTPPPALAGEPAAAEAFWRTQAMGEVQIAVAEEVRSLFELRNAAVELANTLDQSLQTLRKLEENVEQLLEQQRKQFMDLLAGLASGDPAAAANKFLDAQIAARTRQLLNQLAWPMNEFARYLASSRGTGDLEALTRRLLEKLIADAQPRIYTAETDVNILDLTRASSAITVSDQRPASSIEILVELEHSFLGDLEISIEHAGQRYPLANRTGGYADGGEHAFLLSGAGIALSGAWTLHIDDHEVEDTGTLRRWELVAY